MQVVLLLEQYFDDNPNRPMESFAAFTGNANTYKSYAWPVPGTKVPVIDREFFNIKMGMAVAGVIYTLKMYYEDYTSRGDRDLADVALYLHLMRGPLCFPDVTRREFLANIRKLTKNDGAAIEYMRLKYGTYTFDQYLEDRQVDPPLGAASA
jgi:hypothetical protein